MYWGSSILTGQPEVGTAARLNEGSPRLLDPRCVQEQREGEPRTVVDRSDDASCLLGLEGLAVERVVLTGPGVKIVQLVTDDPEAARCPACRMVSTSGKDWVLTRPRDLPCGGEFAQVQWRKRRWRCRTEVCPRASFTEQVAQVPAGMRTTTRLRTALAVAVEDGRARTGHGAGHGRDPVRAGAVAA